MKYFIFYVDFYYTFFSQSWALKKRTEDNFFVDFSV